MRSLSIRGVNLVVLVAVSVRRWLLIFRKIYVNMYLRDILEIPDVPNQCKEPARFYL